MDIKYLVETVNLAEPFKSRVLAQQSFGRTRGDNTIYKDIVDMGFPQTRAYYNFKKPVFTKYAFEPFASIFLTNSSAYFVGCNSKNA